MIAVTGTASCSLVEEVVNLQLGDTLWDHDASYHNEIKGRQVVSHGIPSSGHGKGHEEAAWPLKTSHCGGWSLRGGTPGGGENGRKRGRSHNRTSADGRPRGLSPPRVGVESGAGCAARASQELLRQFEVQIMPSQLQISSRSNCRISWMQVWKLV